MDFGTTGIFFYLTLPAAPIKCANLRKRKLTHFTSGSSDYADEMTLAHDYFANNLKVFITYWFVSQVDEGVSIVIYLAIRWYDGAVSISRIQILSCKPYHCWMWLEESYTRAEAHSGVKHTHIRFAALWLTTYVHPNQTLATKVGTARNNWEARGCCLF